jgi:hypothetical protein
MYFATQIFKTKLLLLLGAWIFPKNPHLPKYHFTYPFFNNFFQIQLQLTT